MKDKTKVSKTKYIILFGIMAMLLGAFSGACIGLFLKLADLGMTALWGGEHSLAYHLAICLSGAILIGVWQKKYGILPDSLEVVIGTIKFKGGYPYDRLGVVAVAALLPLIFGAVVGPEAGMSGLAAGLCYWVSTSLKSRGDQLAAIFGDKETPEVLAEAGVAATLGIIFGNPLFGIIGNLEPDNEGEKYREKLVAKKGRIYIYFMAVVGGLLAMRGINLIFGALGNATGLVIIRDLAEAGGLPRFGRNHAVGIDQWKWVVPLIAVGIILAVIYAIILKVTSNLAARIKTQRILSCLIAGVCVAFVGFYMPDTLFSGEDKLAEYIAGWESMSATQLIIIGLVKLLMVNICISFGWRGGSIFPIIFSGASIGFGAALVVGMDGAYAAAIVIAAMQAFLSRKPLMTIAILLLCFPITYLPPIIVAAFVSAKVSKLLPRKESDNE